MIPFSASLTTNAEQVKAICLSQARSAEMNARARAQAAVRPYQPPPVPDIGALVHGYDSARAVDDAGSSAFNAVLQTCMAQYGWRLERYCVQNCN